MALGFGATLGPLFHLLTPDWGLLLCGFLAGSLAYLGSRQPSWIPLCFAPQGLDKAATGG